MAKRIAVFADGTWNTPAQANPTNVIRLKDVTLEQGEDGIAQASFYDEAWAQKGIGGKNCWEGFRV